MHNKSRYGLGVVFLLATGAIVYGFIALADALAQDGPPGPGWREIKPYRSPLQRWRDGERNTRSPRPKPAKPAAPK